MRMFYLTVTAGLCAVASCAWAGVSFREGGVAPTTRSPLPSTIVERMHKADRMAGASNARGAGAPAFSIETANSLESTVTLRDSNGSILYQVSQWIARLLSPNAQRRSPSFQIYLNTCLPRNPRGSRKCLTVARAPSARTSRRAWQT
jgi:hypothetical protein